MRDAEVGKMEATRQAYREFAKMGALPSVRRHLKQTNENLGMIANAANGIAESVKILRFPNGYKVAGDVLKGVQGLCDTMKQEVSQIKVKLDALDESTALVDKDLRGIRGYEIQPLSVAFKYDINCNDDGFVNALKEARKGSPDECMGKLILIKAQLQNERKSWQSKALKLRERGIGKGSTIHELNVVADKLLAAEFAVEQIDKRLDSVNELYLSTMSAWRKRMERIARKWDEAEEV